MDIIEIIDEVIRSSRNVTDTEKMFTKIFGVKPDKCEIYGNAITCYKRITKREAARCCNVYEKIIAKVERSARLTPLRELFIAVELQPSDYRNGDEDVEIHNVRVLVARAVGVVVATASLVNSNNNTEIGTVWIILK